MKRYGMFLIFCLTGLSVGSVSAQNLLTNPGFDTNLAGWTAFTGTTWEARDANGSPSSGSARVDDTTYLGSTTCYSPASQCVAVTAGNAYDLHGKVFIPSGQSVSGRGYYYIIWHSGAACSGSGTFGQNTPAVDSSSQTNAWFSGSADNIVVPIGNVSATIAANVCKDAAATFVANYDDVFFGPHLVASRTSLPAILFLLLN